MKKEKLYASRYGAERKLKQVTDDQFIIYGKSYFGRSIGDNLKKPEAVDFEGGPFISVGNNLQDFGSKLDKIIIHIFPWKSKEGSMAYLLITEDG
jgi:hypothetical protein